uniref:tetratricopeptide repeat protein n=1 Tax=Crenothrix polyspora TaxID=360316 RepID=UPI00211B1D5C
MYEGGVRFFNTQGSIHLKPGQGAQAHLGQSPQAQIDIKPQDAVNWALYYPPLLPYPEITTLIDSDIRRAIREFRLGHVDVALSRLDVLSPDKKTPYFFKVRGAMRLTVGLDKLALQDIQALLANNPNDAQALALQSVLALTQNRKDEAYTLANRATVADPHSATAYSALSYAEQGRFELDRALQAANKATEYAPHDAMVWARKAELELALGLTSESKQTAQRALGLDATLERTQTVMGFSQLLRMDTDEALQSFENAVKLDSSSPLARLGLGLAKIRSGDLEAGRQDLEIAAILDPGNSLIRSYLGKAYYEEKRNSLAEDQFSLAKQRDPKDPTPYFYDALKKQTENRPVEALQDLQKAMALNDNRAVYRSRQLLDSDRAARGASLAWIYDTLGFNQRGILEASNSLAVDPTNYSAHRFLSDSYVRFPARGAAQTSELLQAQLLQPININPIQPHLSVSNRSMPIGLGVSEPLFRDYTRVFERNRPQLTVSGLYGNLDTNGDEVVLSGIYDNISYSFGQFHFSSDGFRTHNADINHDIYNAFLQAAITDKLNIQFEYLHKETKQGNIIQDLQPGLTYDESFYLNQDKMRGGFHFQPFHNIDLVGTVANLPEIELISTPIKDYLPNQRKDVYSGWAGEIQLIWKTEVANFIFGGATSQRRNSGSSARYYNKSYPKLLETDEGNTFYAYSYFNLPLNISSTIGVKHSYFNTIKGQTDKPFSRWQPKIGIQWNPIKQIALRFAYSEGIKTSLFSDQTIEPTQIAGFNQLYDDFDGQISSLIGAAIDFNGSKNILSGFQFNQRNIETVSFNNYPKQQPFILPSRKLDSYKAYLYWMLSSDFILSSEYIFEKDDLYANSELDYLTTNKVPISLRYFNTYGFFGQFGITYISQNQAKLSGLNNYT